MKKNDSLHRIMENLKAGKQYGHQINTVRFPYFHANLAIGRSAFNGKSYIYWSHAGSSANRVTLKDLNWIIRSIFNTTPELFEQNYELQERKY